MKLLKVSKAAEKLDISRGHIYKMIRSGELPFIEVFGCIRISEDYLNVMIKKQLNDQLAGKDTETIETTVTALPGDS